MVEEILNTKCRIRFDPDALDRWHIPHTIEQHAGKYSSLVEGNGVPVSEDGPSRGHDRQDALEPMADELWKTPLWWVFEILPALYTYQDTKGELVTRWW